MPTVTIRDVAKTAGVGIATVSRVLNGSEQVRPDTRQRVLEAIDSLGYVPNDAARQLSGGKTMDIGIVTPFFTVPSFSERLAGIQQMLWDSQYDLVLHSVSSPRKLEGKLVSLLRQNRVDGVILLTPPRLPADIHDINPNIPIVVLDSHYFKDSCPGILIDDVRGGRIATEYLIEHGHRHIGFIGDEPEDDFGFTSTTHRYRGYQVAMQRAELPLRDDWCFLGSIGHAAARKHARTLLSLPQRPTAVFATSDIKAFDVINVAQEMGLRVPEDIAVIGFDDIEASRYMKLTTVRQHLYDGGRQAAATLLDMLAADDFTTAMHHTMPLEIIERETV
ncbi:MAG: LacI family DNA-binding transcriptional regulator [Chloroflexota bacterium]